MPFVLVLGMHRSGTSFLTRSLHEAGLRLGDGLMGEGCANLEGHWESVEIVRLNDRLLDLSGGSWDRVPPSLRCDDATKAEMAALLDRLRAEGVAGWKDPRTTVTFPLWRPLLGDYRIVAALRHPTAVARSLHVRDGWPLDRGLDLWCDYNERLLRHVSGERDVLWFDFDAGPDRIAADVRGICRSLGLTSGPAVEDLFNPYLRHHSESEPVAHPRAAALYERLRAAAAAASTVRTADEPTAGRDASMAARLEQLGRAQALQNAAIQSLAREVAACAELAQQVVDLRMRVRELESLSLMSRFYAPFRRSVRRVVRRWSKSLRGRTPQRTTTDGSDRRTRDDGEQAGRMAA